LNEMGVFWSANEILVVMFLGVDGVAFRWFEVEWGFVVPMLEAIWAGLSFTGDTLVVWGKRDISGSPGVKGMRKGCAGGEVSGCDDTLSVLLGTPEVVLMGDERGVVVSKRAGLYGAGVEELVGGGVSVYVVGSVEDV
jgi:hypothetical protein